MTRTVDGGGASTRRVGTGEDLVRLLADPQRLAIAGRLATGPHTVPDVATSCGIRPRDLHRQLPRLIASGLVTTDGDLLRLNVRLLRELAETLPRADPIRPHLLVGLSAEDAAVAARYFDGDRLTDIPVGRARRGVVLGILVDEFEPGRYYPESEVRRILRKFHPDDAALRRYLVEEGLLARENASRRYWRTPGPPPPAGERVAERRPVD
jgi:hypothetical protein